MAGAGGGDLRDGVSVPYELLQWSQSDDAKAVAEKIRGKTDATAIDLVSARPGKASFQISAASADCLRAARSLLETHLSFQIEYQQRKQQTEKMEEDLRATNAEFETGQRVEFSVPENLIGLVIGKGGARVTKVKEDTGVERIIVDARTRVVRIRGRDPEAVRRARDMLEYEEIALPLQPGQPRTIIGERGRNIAEIMRKSGCVNIMVEKDRFLRIVGTKKAVQLAQDLVETQLEYEQKMSSLRVNEANIQRQLSAIDANYRDFAGHNGPRSRQQQRRDGFQSSADDASHRSRGSGSSSVKVTELATTIKNNTNNNKTKMEHQHGSKNNNVANNKAPKAGTSAAVRGAGQPQPPKQAQSQQPVRDDATTATKDKVVQPARANPSSSNNNKKKKKAVAAAVATTAAAAANPSSESKGAATATNENGGKAKASKPSSDKNTSQQEKGAKPQIKKAESATTSGPTKSTKASKNKSKANKAAAAQEANEGKTTTEAKPPVPASSKAAVPKPASEPKEKKQTSTKETANASSELEKEKTQEQVPSKASKSKAKRKQQRKQAAAAAPAATTSSESTSSATPASDDAKAPKASAKKAPSSSSSSSSSVSASEPKTAKATAKSAHGSKSKAVNGETKSKKQQKSQQGETAKPSKQPEAQSSQSEKSAAAPAAVPAPGPAPQQQKASVSSKGKRGGKNKSKAATDATGEASKSSSPSEEVPAPTAPVLEKQQERGQPTGPSTKPKRNNHKAKGSNKQKPVTSSVKDAPAENVGPNKATEQPNTLRSQQPSKKQAPKQKAPSAAVTKETIPSADPGPKQEEKTKA